ncbi:hypothetical protein YC2023_068041 [Brassica napus]
MGMRMDMSLLLLKSNLELMYKKKKQYFALSSSHISLYVHLYSGGESEFGDLTMRAKIDSLTSSRTLMDAEYLEEEADEETEEEAQEDETAIQVACVSPCLSINL